MAWAKRGQSAYYYRSQRVGKRVVSEYLGSGPEAEISARLDSRRREQRRETRELWNRSVARLQEADRLLDELSRRSQLLASAVLILSGLHNHNGEWRRRRVNRTRSPRK
jgi:hypothetical protein